MSCTPCICEVLSSTGFRERLECTAINEVLESTPRLSQLYTLIYHVGRSLPVILSGNSSIIEDGIITWFIVLTLFLILPWIIMFITLIIILFIRSLISYDMTIVLIISTILLGFISIIIVYILTRYFLSDISNKVRNNVQSNWNDNGRTIVSTATDAYLQCPYCSSDIPGCPTKCSGICHPNCRALPSDTITPASSSTTSETNSTLLQTNPTYKQ